MRVFKLIKVFFDRYGNKEKENTNNLRNIPIILFSYSRCYFNFYLFTYFVFIIASYIMGLKGPNLWISNNIVENLIVDLDKGDVNFKSSILSIYHDTVWIFLKLPRTDIDTYIPINESYVNVNIMCKLLDFNNWNKSIPIHFLVDFQGYQQCTNYLIDPNFNLYNKVYIHEGEFAQRLIFHSKIVSTDPFVVAGQVSLSPRLVSLGDKNCLGNASFRVITYDPEFIVAETWLHIFGSLLSLIAMGLFYWRIKKFCRDDLIYEQKWIALLLPLNFVYNNPLFAVALVKPTSVLNVWFQNVGATLFLGALTTFWLCLFGRLKQDPRIGDNLSTYTTVRFYVCKIALVSSMWGLAFLLNHMTSINYGRLSMDPLEEIPPNGVLVKILRKFTLICFVWYTAYLFGSAIKTYVELRSLALYEIRLKFSIVMMIVPLLTTIIFSAFWRTGSVSHGKDFTYPSYSQRNPFFAYRNFASLLFHRFCTNLYIVMLAYAYSPPKEASNSVEFAEYGMKDILNDSDEEEDLIYSYKFKKDRKTIKNNKPIVKGIFPIDMEMNEDGL